MVVAPWPSLGGQLVELLIPSMQQQKEAAGGAGLQMQMRVKEEEEEELQVLATWDCGSPLYDSFELASLHYILEKHTMILPFPDTAGSRSRRRSQRRHHRGGGRAAMAPNVAKTGNCGAGAARRTRGRWGSKAAAAIFRAVTCWRSEVIE